MPRLASYQGLGAPGLRVTNLSSASTALTLTDDQQSALLIWNSQSSASRISLPAPEIGMQYTIFMGGDAVSSATKFISNGAGTYDFYYASTAAVETTGVAVAFGSTAEGGLFVEFTAISDVRWAITKQPYSTVAGAALQSTST